MHNCLGNFGSRRRSVDITRRQLRELEKSTNSNKENRNSQPEAPTSSNENIATMRMLMIDFQEWAPASRQISTETKIETTNQSTKMEQDSEAQVESDQSDGLDCKHGPNGSPMPTTTSQKHLLQSSMVMLITISLFVAVSPIRGDTIGLSPQGDASAQLTLPGRPQLEWSRMGSSFLRQLGASIASGPSLDRQEFGNRWVSLSSLQGGSGDSSGGPLSSGGGATRRPLWNFWDMSRVSTSQPGLKRQNQIRRAINRLWTRIGARNSIRVHNAFRDFAWRVLSSFSMPTPVIYELRRQHFYSPDEDLQNDSFFNRNTSKSIRTRRMIETAQAPGREVIKRRQSDDDDEPESWRERMGSRLEDLVQLSRRSVFGRVVRLPFLFPFKRQEGSDAAAGRLTPPPTTSSQQAEVSAPASTNSPATKSWRKRLQALRRKRKDTERQMISINGKQYYVDDDGELKELAKEPAEKKKKRR